MPTAANEASTCSLPQPPSVYFSDVSSAAVPLRNDVHVSNIASWATKCPVLSSVCNHKFSLKDAVRETSCSTSRLKELQSVSLHPIAKVDDHQGPAKEEKTKSCPLSPLPGRLPAFWAIHSPLVDATSIGSGSCPAVMPLHLAVAAF